MKQALGMGSYYRRFIQAYSDRMIALDLTKKGKTFIWTESCEVAFEDLKRALTGPEIMAFPTDDGELILDTHASDVGISGVLSQVQDKRDGVAQWIGRRISDQGVPGSIPRRCTFRCGLEQVTFTLCLVLVKPRKRWTDDQLGQTVTRLEIMLCLMC